MSKSGQKTGRPRNKIWEEFEVDAELSKKRYCRCRWCGSDVKADTARMYYHVTDRCQRIDEPTRQKYQTRISEGQQDAVEADASGGRGGHGKDPTAQETHKLESLLKSKGGRPKDPIWHEFQTNDDLRKRRYCLCVWCEKEVKGDTSRMLGHILERCTSVDEPTKAKYAKRKHDERHGGGRNDGDLSDLDAADVAAMTSVPAKKPKPSPAPPRQGALTMPHYAFLKDLGLKEENRGVFCGEWFGSGPIVAAMNPTTNETIATVRRGTREDYLHVVNSMDHAKMEWRQVPVSQRAQLVAHLAQAFRMKQQGLAQLITLEMGVVLDVSMRLVETMIQSCDAAVAAARAIQDAVRPSSSQPHLVTLERYSPLDGHVGLLTPFHAPCWHGALALVCGNAVLWKPSLVLTAVAIVKIIADVFVRKGHNPMLASMVCGSGPEIGGLLAQDKRMAVVSYTGSADIGHRVGVAVADRMGQTISTLDVHHTIVVDADANLDLALRLVLAAMGKRTLRRLFVHVEVCDLFLNKVSMCYGDIIVGDPFNTATVCGPLRDDEAVQKFSNTINTIQITCGQVLIGGSVLDCPGNFVSPALIMVNDFPTNPVDMLSPITFVSKFHVLDHVMDERPLERIVLFTASPTAAFKWTGFNVVGVNCDFPEDADVQDDWKQYMRRSTCRFSLGGSNHHHQPPQAALDPATMTTLHVL
ncbi:Aste57867_9086 [Aphanomyces stellatus]|uniref:Aste57867_9086 protein n=1 Tax=Aphanomyces stellatus TaxID=120398 RepID=A0A485KMB7_9STRA|nr:hypothetical protein As57867_009050 [Aphanomyces stellatus]VFT85970.1 Aste57867_9086 [Aphanomyces stellatus]